MDKAVKAIKLASGSFSLCLLLCFAVFETFVNYCPSAALQFLGPNQLKDRPPVLTKLGNYESDHPVRPTILLAGSSLAQFASNCCDFHFYGSPDLNKDYAAYSHFRYFDKLLASLQALPLETANLSNSGTMISEDFLVIKEAFRKKNPPRAVVLEIGPRDFIDNMAPEPNRSRLAQVLSRRQEPFSWRLDRNVSENMDVVAEKLSLFYSIRGEFHDCLIKIICDQTNHPASVYQASLMAKLAPPPSDQAGQNEAAVCDAARPNAPAKSVMPARPSPASLTGPPVNLKVGFLEDKVGSEALQTYTEHEYRGRYLPLNTKRWPVEIECLKNIVAFCKSKNVPLIVVNMPLTERNLNILPNNFRDQYERTVKSICTPAKGDSGLAYVNLRQDTRFVLSDFRDIAHMHSTGGKKLADLLAPIVVLQLSQVGISSSTNTKFAAKSGNLN